MTELFEELIDAATCRDGGGNTTLTRGFHLADLAGNPGDKVSNALLDPRIPNLGDPHPSRGFLFVLSRSAKMVDVNQARVDVEYGIPKVESGDTPPGGGGGIAGPATGTTTDQGTISVGSSATTERTFSDVRGTLMAVSSNVEKEKQVTNPKTGVKAKQKVIEEETQIREAEVVRPQTVLRVTRIESGSPDVKSRKYVGTVNSRPVGVSTIRSKRDKAWTWLCTRIDGVSNDGGNTYQVSYEFQYNPEDWTFTAQFIDKKTGQPPTDARLLTGEETKLYQVYPEADFNELGIRFEGDTSK